MNKDIMMTGDIFDFDI